MSRLEACAVYKYLILAMAIITHHSIIKAANLQTIVIEDVWNDHITSVNAKIARILS